MAVIKLILDRQTVTDRNKAGDKVYRLENNFMAQLKQEEEISERNVNRSDKGGQRFLRFLLFD